MCVCVCVTVFLYVCVECNRDHHSEILRAGMNAPLASCQRELTLSKKSRQREEASDGLKHGSGVFYYCRTYYKAVRVGGEESGGHVLRETTSRGLCGLVCPSRTSERGG